MLTLLGVDTGGTFTDFVCLRAGKLFVHKVLSTPAFPQQAIMKGISDMGLEAAMAAGELLIVHGTTVATNAALEGRGVRTVYITNRGMKDVLQIGRQARKSLYNLAPGARQSAFDPKLTIEVNARTDAAGTNLVSLSESELTSLRNQVAQLRPKAIAINLLFSFLNPAQELAIEAQLQDSWFVSRSSAIMPEYREYERGVTTWLNAWLGPLMNAYLRDLEASVAPSHLSIMQSSGLTVTAGLASERAVNLLLSGPAGGLSAACFIGNLTGKKDLMTFDMGGTSTDVALILDGRFKLTNEGRIAGFPVGVPMADIHTIGAGGGSIAYIDEGGLLNVGPRSAGANPGPACYGNGGTEPTVTDANLILGRLGPDTLLAGEIPVDFKAAEQAVAKLGRQLGLSTTDTALGILGIANEHMAQALRVISVQQGFDPRSFCLMCFGGAGGLHLCDVAEALEMTRAMVPRNGGVLSAFGMLTAQPGREMVKTHRTPIRLVSDKTLQSLFADLAEAPVQELCREGATETTVRQSLDMRYVGQTFTITVPYGGDPTATEARFHQLHKQQHGHDLARPAEILNLRLHIEARRGDINLPKIEEGPATAEKGNLDRIGLPGLAEPGLAEPVPAEPEVIAHRQELLSGTLIAGPALIKEAHASTYIKPGWLAQVDQFGNLQLTLEEST